MDGGLIWWGFVGSLLAGLATAVGALPILSMRHPTDQQQNVLLGFAAGVMLAASVFSLILPGFQKAVEAGSVPVSAGAVIFAAVALGALAVRGLDGIVPPIDRLNLGPKGIADSAVRRIWLFIAAITLHNFPEGMAVGVSFAGGPEMGRVTALGIGLQNMPEGLAVAVALTAIGYSRGYALFVALVSGLVEPVGGLLGVLVTSAVSALLPWGLGFAGGAMIYVVASEIIPDIRKRTGAPRAAAGLMVGLAAMMFLDVTLG
jgi:ZIP family zinc transporter